MTGKLRRRWGRFRCHRERHKLRITYAYCAYDGLVEVLACKRCHELEYSVWARRAAYKQKKRRAAN